MAGESPGQSMGRGPEPPTIPPRLITGRDKTGGGMLSDMVAPGPEIALAAAAIGKIDVDKLPATKVPLKPWSGTTPEWHFAIGDLVANALLNQLIASVSPPT